MRGNNVLGLIFANVHDEEVPELTGIRSMASVPFGGGYRLVDFALSNLVNAGVTKVGVLTNNNYQSLMDHIGSGKPWDLARKNDGLYFLPPFNATAVHNYNAGEVGALHNILNFLERSEQEYVFMTSCSYVANIDLEAVFAAHEQSGADITMVSHVGVAPGFENQPIVESKFGDLITSLRLGEPTGGEEEYLLTNCLLKKSLVERLVREAFSRGEYSLFKDVLRRAVGRVKIHTYEHKGFVANVNSLAAYFKGNFDLLRRENYESLFRTDRPVMTKVYEDMPAVYGIGSNARASLVADGCIIDGTVENCILFRGCRVEKGAEVKNSILMPMAFVGEGAKLNYVLADKSVSVRSGKTLSGAETYPVYIGKGIQI